MSDVRNDHSLAEHTRTRSGQAQSMMSQWAIQGIPQRVAVVGERTRVIAPQALYQSPADLIAELEQTLRFALA